MVLHHPHRYGFFEQGKERESRSLSPVDDTHSLFSGPSRSPSPDSDTPLGQRPKPPGAEGTVSAPFPPPEASASDNPSATMATLGGGSSRNPSAMKPPRALPAHKERQANPRVKMMDFGDPSLGVSGGSAIPTKQKLAKGGSSSFATTKPSILPSLVIPSKKVTMQGLSFKKKSIITPISPALPSASTTAASFTTAVAGPSHFTDAQEFVQSPTSMVSGDGGWGSPAPESPHITRRPSLSRPQTQPTRDPR